MIKVVVGKNYEDMCEKVAKFYKENWNNIHVLGLATGSTPVGLYKNLIKMNENGEISFKDIKTVNLDEYIGLPDGHKESYRQFMNDNLFDHVDIDKNKTNVPHAKDEKDIEACEKYDAIIDKMGGIDIQLLGVGENGHIGFNEPSSELHGDTNIVKLTDSTINANKRFFNSIDEVPKYSITMGMGKIMSAKKIVLMANGEKKVDAMRKLLMDDIITTMCPCTLLKLHNDVTVFIDEEINKALGNKF